MTGLRDALLIRIDSYLSRTGTAPSRFGFEVVKDRAFVSDLREGRDVRLATYAKIMNWLDENDPPPRKVRKRNGVVV